jgi:hypothetical protein
MSNIAGKAYAMNVLTPSPPGRTWINRLIFMVSRGRPATLGGLLGLSLIHFARWVIVRRGDWPDLGQGPQRLKYDYMIFCSNFNGTWDQYIDAFSDGIPNGLNLFWYSATKYPKSIPITPFKSYISHNQLDTGYYYNATETPEQFAESYRNALVAVQGALGDQGYGPVASLATEAADVNRGAAVRAVAAARAG